MKKTLLILAAAAILGISGCSSSQGTESSANLSSNTNSQPTVDLTEIDLVLDWYPNAVHAFVYDAIEKDIMKTRALK